MLYRKYRPQTFPQIVGQNHVVQTLLGALKTGRIGHAYLFTGSRGAGKTTLARILAKALNCADFGKVGGDFIEKPNIPCNKCESCLAVNNGTSLDLIEIDAASQTGVDNIRELTDSAMVSAPGGKYKIFLIDEAHMLSKSAFNALLKILEEPPAHVIFILATTEPHKILPTVLSRVQRFDFKRLTPQEILSKLKAISKAEKIQITDDALLAVARSADGALRDAEVALTKIRNIAAQGSVGEAEILGILGLIPSSYHPKFLEFLASGDKASAIGLIHEIHDAGLDLDHFAKDFIAYTRSVLLSNVNPALSAAMYGPGIHAQLTAFKTLDDVKIIKIINAFTTARSQIKFSPIPQLPLELAVLQL